MDRFWVRFLLTLNKKEKLMRNVSFVNTYITLLYLPVIMEVNYFSGQTED